MQSNAGTIRIDQSFGACFRIPSAEWYAWIRQIPRGVGDDIVTTWFIIIRSSSCSIIRFGIVGDNGIMFGFGEEEYIIGGGGWMSER